MLLPIRCTLRTLVTATFGIGLLLLLWWTRVASSRQKYADWRQLGDQTGQSISSIASDIFVISLPRRKDRRATMKRIAEALRLRFHFIDAIDARHRDITRILARVRQRRWLLYTNPKEATRGSFYDAMEEHIEPTQYWGSDTWTLDPSNPLSADALNPLTPEDLLDPDDTFPIPCARGNPFNPKQFTPSTSIKDIISGNNGGSSPSSPTLLASNILSRAMVACWHSHVQVIRHIASSPVSSPQQAFIVFEDDVDLEWDFKERLHTMWPFLPSTWEVIMLGHCWSDESRYPPLNNSHLHPSNSPLCTHAYVLSSQGARQLYNFLRHPAFAYSRPFDQAMAFLIRRGHLDNAFSVVPSIVVQAKEDGSDIWTTRRGSRWKDTLENSTRKRIRRSSLFHFTWFREE